MLLLKNSFKSLGENKAKIGGIVVLVMLASFLFSLLTNSASTLTQSIDDYFGSQNVYDFTLLPVLPSTQAGTEEDQVDPGEEDGVDGEEDGVDPDEDEVDAD